MPRGNWAGAGDLAAAPALWESVSCSLPNQSARLLSSLIPERELDPIAYTELVENVKQIISNGLFADREFLGNLSIS
jgi:hypothetical protein